MFYQDTKDFNLENEEIHRDLRSPLFVSKNKFLVE